MTPVQKICEADCRCTSGKECVDVTVKYSVHRHQKDERAYSTSCGSAAQGLSTSKTIRELLASANRVSFHFTPCASVDQGHAAFPEQQAGKRPSTQLNHQAQTMQRPWTQLNHQAQTMQRPWTQKRMKSCLTSIYFGAHVP